MISFDFMNECYGCGLCSVICPNEAIEITDQMIPLVDKGKCINCNKCEYRCLHLNTHGLKVSYDIECFAGKNKDDKTRLQSSSGGVFFPLAKIFLNNGDYVCGCIYDEDFMPKHIVSNQIDQVKKMMGSKYAQSELHSCLSEIMRVLDDGKSLLFTGVPCQVEAVKRLVPERLQERLFLVSIICHGAMSRDYWEMYLSLDKQRNGPISFVTMRDKSKEWSNYGLRIIHKNGVEVISYRKEDGYFLKAYTDGLLQRERCLHCEYKGENIHADLVLGDGWGLDELLPDFADSLGTSVIVVKNERGKRLLNSVAEDIDLIKIDLSFVYKRNPRLNSPPEENIDRKAFIYDYLINPKSIDSLCKKYANTTYYNKARIKVKTMLKKLFGTH